MRSGKCCGCGWGGAGIAGARLRTIGGHCGLDRKTVRRYVRGRPGSWKLTREDGVEALDDGLIRAVAEAVRPVRPRGHGAAWEQLLGFEKQISDWVAGTEEQRPLTVTKIHCWPVRGCGAVSDVAPLRL